MPARRPTQFLLKLVVGAAAASVLAAIIIGGGLIVATQLPRVVEGWQSRGWPSAQATIVHSTAVRKAWKPRTSTRSTYGTHAVQVRYAFEVAGRRHEGWRRSLDSEGKLLTERGANAVVDELPVARRVLVYYNPSDPRQSLLEPGVPFGIVIAVLLGTLLLGAGLLAALAVWKGVMRSR